VHSLSEFTPSSQKFQPLPTPNGPPPYQYNLGAAVPDIDATAKKNKKIVFHTVGDTGGIKVASATAAL